MKIRVRGTTTAGVAKGAGAPRSSPARPSLALLVLTACFLLGTAPQALAAAPQVSNAAASEVLASTAHLEGTVNPRGTATTYRFQYLTQAQWEAAGKTFTGATSTPPVPAAIGSGTVDVAVARDISGLLASTAYRARLLASSSEGTDELEFTFDTFSGVPQASGAVASAVIATTARLEGAVNPRGAPATYQFKYVTLAQWEQAEGEKPGEGFKEAETVPASPAEAGSGTESVTVAQEVSGLEPDTAYRFVLLVQSANGTAKNEGTFTTLAEVGASQVHATTALLEGFLNPAGKATAYRFEYLTQAQWEAAGESFAGAATVPASPSSVGSDNEDIAVAEKVSGLQPATTYRIHLLAISEEGTSESKEATFTTYDLPQVFDSCSNQEFRGGPGANLPDCRAYEQASPIDKNGGNIGGGGSLVTASTGGDGVTFESQAGLPGGEGSQSFPIYMASREAGNWVTRGLLPPASAGEAADVAGWTPDFDWVFTNAIQTVGTDEALLARSRTGGPLSEVVPYGQTFGHRISGFSADDDTVVFGSEGALAVKAGDPSPAAGQPNVYAWDRTGEERSLLGVLPNGSVPSEGTIPIGGYASEMRAVAEDGSAFFNDRKERQLYLRLHPTANENPAKDGKGNCVPDAALACTLEVSESERSTPDPGGTFPATFRGASADGSVSFFTSKGELTDDAHTIAPSKVIGRAEVPSGNEPPIEIESAHVIGPDVDALDADASHLYWVNTAAGTIGRVGLDGEDEEPACIAIPTVEVEAGVFAPPKPAGIVVGKGADSGHLYWTSPADKGTGHGVIGRADISGSCAAAQTSAEPEFITGASNPLGIDTDGTYLYWANRGSFSVGRAMIDGSTEVDPGWFKGTSLSRAIDVAADAAHGYLFIGRGKGGEIARINLANPTAEQIGLPVEAKNAQQIATDGAHIYWTYAVTEAGATENIARSDLNGNHAEQDFIPAQSPAGIAVGAGADSGHIYWGAHPSGRGEDLYRYDAETQELADVAPAAKATHGADLQGVLGTSEDGAYAYFVANGSFDGASDGTCNGGSGSCNLYLWHEGDPIEFIARLGAVDASDWATGPPVKNARVSADGRTVLFRSTRQLSAYDNRGQAEFYRWRAGDAEPTCVTCDPTGAPPAGPARLSSIAHPALLGAEIQMGLISRNLSADGNRVFFETRDPLIAADTNGDGGCPGWGTAGQAAVIKTCQDVYEWEAKGTGSCESEAQNGGCLYLLSAGTSEQASFFADADPSGDNAFIYTDSQLVGQDEDGLIDVYDVRAGGGLASQTREPRVACEAESCKPPAPASPSAESPVSAAVIGPENPRSVRRPTCPKGRHAVRRHGKTRCLKRRKAKKTRRGSQ